VQSMKIHGKLAILCVVSGLISGCAKPDTVVRIQSPDPEVFYTIETFRGHGAIDNDYTNVWAHLQHNGSAGKLEVLSGVYVTVSKILWIRPRENTICLEGGYTSLFRNTAVLRAGGRTVTLHSHLQEPCCYVPKP
jgi:hypothetical protein